MYEIYCLIKVSDFTITSIWYKDKDLKFMKRKLTQFKKLRPELDFKIRKAGKV